MAELYNWRYKNLGNLPTVIEPDEYKWANAGFTFDYQLINVGEFMNKGETEPVPYFYQVRINAVLVYFNMVLINK